MPSCSNCGAFVTREYARVFSIPGEDGVRVCPSCPNKIREDGVKVREKRA